MFLIPPSSRAVTALNFLVPDYYARSFLLITRPTGGAVTMDGVMLSGPTAPAGAGHEQLSVAVLSGPHSITATAPINVFVTGSGFASGYAYPAGFDMR